MLWSVRVACRDELKDVCHHTRSCVSVREGVDRFRVDCFR